MSAISGGIMEKETERSRPCPNCHNPFTRRDVLRRLNARSFLPILSGCDVCRSVWTEAPAERSEAK